MGGEQAQVTQTPCRIKIMGLEDRGQDHWIRFTWSGFGDAWTDALNAVKRIPADLREYDEVTKVWSVRGTAETQMSLSALFSNFWPLLDAAQHPQEALFAADEVSA